MHASQVLYARQKNTKTKGNAVKLSETRLECTFKAVYAKTTREKAQFSHVFHSLSHEFHLMCAPPAGNVGVRGPSMPDLFICRAARNIEMEDRLGATGQHRPIRTYNNMADTGSESIAVLPANGCMISCCQLANHRFHD